jgi:hypothetical protein
MTTKGLGYLIHHRMDQSLNKGIPLQEQGFMLMINGHCDDDSFITILEDQTSMENIMDYL